MQTTLRDVLFDPTQSHDVDLAESLSRDNGPATDFIRFVPVEEVVEILWELLDLPLADVVFRAWDSYEEVGAAKQRTAGKTQAIEHVKLVKHKVDWTCHPKMELTMIGVRVPALTFDVALEIELASAVARVKNGRVEDIVVGNASAKATLATKGRKLADTKSVELTLPNPIVAIRPAE